MELESIAKISFYTSILVPISSKQTLWLPRKGKNARKKIEKERKKMEKERDRKERGRREGKRKDNKLPFIKHVEVHSLYFINFVKHLACVIEFNLH